MACKKPKNMPTPCPTSEEDRMRFFMDSSVEGFSLLDSNLNYLWVNKAWLKVRGFTKEEVIGKNILELFQGIDRKKRYVAYKRVLKTGKPYYGEAIGIGSKYGEFYFDLKAFKAGECLGIITVDITKRRNTELELKKSYKTTKNIIDKSPFAIYVVDKKGDIDYVNPAMVNLTTYGHTAFMGLNVLSRPSYIKLGIAKKIKGVLRGKSFLMGPVTYTSHEGKKTTVRNFVGIPLEEHGERKALIFVEDITERMGAEQEIKDASQTMKNILDKAPIGIYLLDGGGNMEYVNPKMLEISGDTYEYFMGLNAFTLESYMELGLSKSLRNVFKGKSFFAGNVNYISEVSKKRTIRNFYGIPLEQQGELKALIFVEDLTEMKVAEKELAKAYGELKSLDRIKDDFINATSHALKTPLTSITSFIGLLHGEKLGPLTEKQKDGLEIIQSESRRLHRLINHILDSSRIDAGEFVLSKQKVNLTGMIADSITSSSTSTMNNGDEVILDSPGIVYVDADPFWLEKIVDNLINNAVKFTQNGTINVKISKIKNAVKVTIKDTGSGIAEEHLPRLFEKFYRGERHTATGTGLGLYISKKLVKAHGGKIKAISKGKGKGATFWFTLPH